LNPKKSKQFYKEVAEKADVHKDVVADLVYFFYEKFRDNLSNLTSSKIILPNLGTFSLRKTKLEKAIKRNKDILGNLQKTTYKGYEKSVAVKNKLEQMEKALLELNKKIQQKKDFKNENK
jgi:nucleoid DNA-binding protein|tara:strand:- start:27 stop:386 length:360 start_codon:yes stop_codon:yes gene_type:complete